MKQKFPISCFLSLKIIIIFQLFIYSCTDDPISNISTEDSRVYISNYDKKINFKDFKSYSLPDSVFVNNSNRIRTSIKGSDLEFIKIFKYYFEKVGFQNIPKNQQPDIGIAISRIYNSKIGNESPTNIYFNTYWGYTNFGNTGFEYPGFYDTYEIGDTIWNIEAVDLKNTVVNGKLKVIWNAQIHGSDIVNEDNYAFFIEKIIEISPFLNKMK